jgi:hypothetical protein
VLHAIKEIHTMKRTASSGVPVIFTVALALAFIIAFAQPSFSHAASSPVPTPPPFPTNITPIAHPVIGISAITNATGGQGGISEQDVRNYVGNHNIPDNMGEKHPTPSKVVELPAVQVGQLIHNTTFQQDGTMLWYVEFQGNFVFPGSSTQPDGLHFTTAFESFLASDGNLIMHGGLNQPTGNPTGGATPTPNPNATPTPVGAPTATATPGNPPGGTTPPPQPTNTPVPPPLPTKTPVPPTATPKPHVCTLLASSSARLNTDIGYFDFDSGAQSIANAPASDIHYKAAPASTFTAINSTSIHDWGSGSPPCSQYLTVSYTPGGSVAVKANETYMLRTNGGHIAVWTVSTFSPDIIVISWATYKVS